MTPDRTLPVIFQVIEPIGGLYEGWSVACFGERDLCPIGAMAEANVLKDEIFGYSRLNVFGRA